MPAASDTNTARPHGGGPADHVEPGTKRAASSFLARIGQRHGPIVALLYGSRARGDHTDSSDADVAVILPGKAQNRYDVLGLLSDAAYDVLMETGVFIQPLPLWESELRQPELFGNPRLIETILREGVRL